LLIISWIEERILYWPEAGLMKRIPGSVGKARRCTYFNGDTNPNPDL